jgi:class 3 adenylate cyclase/tetratricopeptide (TPR) repeat protein
VDVAGWLKRLGFSQYDATFRDNAIDGDVLPSLTSEDLKDLGVTIVGHRRKLLDAIAALSATGTAREPSPDSPIVQPPSSGAPTRESSYAAAERRPVTVLFCDLVGSTALAARLDAEDWRDLVSPYLDAASEAVVGYGGHVLKRLGDGLMAIFGYPRAQENDVERAARAALAILSALDALNAKYEGRGLPKLAVRVGLDVGPVVVDATGEVFGEAPNVAARVQGAADPGTTLVTAAVQRQIAGLFIAEDRGAHTLKGVPVPVILYRLVRASGGGRRLRARSLTPFVGRKEDLAVPLRRFEQAKGGAGQFVQIIGEPGIGKSRLVEEFRARLGATPHTWVEWATSQLLRNTPLHPLAEWGRVRFGGLDAPAEKRLAELEFALRELKLDAAEIAPVLASLLDIPLPETRAPKCSPDELRRRQLAAVATWILAAARAQPVILTFEDLQWADPTTLDLMKTLAERGATAPLLIVATARPEFHAPWTTRSHHSLISLAPLDRAEIRAMIGSIAERHALASDAVDGVTDRTAGVPLFVEEVTRLLLEGGAQTIPPTLQQSLAARLDRLGSAREVAQIGAVLGREFSYALLSAVATAAEIGYGNAALQTALDRLTEADLLFVEGVAPEATYRFKHALIQDAAYDSLLKSRRQALHRRAAEALLTAPDPQPELVAHHFSEAGETEPAIEWWGKAGDAALGRSAFQEAIARLGKAIQMADNTSAIPQKSNRARTTDAGDRSRIRGEYARALMWGRGIGAEETKAALERTGHELVAETAGRNDGVAILARWAKFFMLGQFELAQNDAESVLRAIECEGRPKDAALAHVYFGSTSLCRGDLRLAREHLDKVLPDASSGFDATSNLLRVYGADAVTRGAAYRSSAAWHLGEFALARALANVAAETAPIAGGPAPVVVAAVIIDLDIMKRDAGATLSAADRLIASAVRFGTPFFEGFGKIFKSWALGRLQDPAQFALELRRGLDSYIETGSRMRLGYFHGLLAELESLAGNTTTALQELDEALAISVKTGEHLTDPFLHRLRGDALLKHGRFNPSAPEEAYRAAIAVATRQSARSEALLASLSLAKLCQSTGRPVEARAVLTLALEGFAPSADMPEIAEAHATLASLGSN